MPVAAIVTIVVARAIAHRTQPIDPVLAEVNDKLTAVAEALEGLVPESSPAHAS
jgi:antitoxin component of RelBE/YafQ-DinJ toxin-antitoxin module